MSRIRAWIGKMSIGKKFIFYTYSVLVPILLLISLYLWLHNYERLREEREAACQADVRALSDSAELIFADVHNISNYIIINQDIRSILDSDNAQELNRDARLWQHRAAIQMVEDMMAMKGGIKTIAIYPENGVMPYLRCIDAVSAYLPGLDEVRRTSLYQKAVERRGGSGWVYVEKGSSEVYTANRTEKIVLYREIYDLSKKTPLAYLAVGMSVEELEKICRNAVGSPEESVRITSGDEVLYSYGPFPEDGNYDYFYYEEEDFGMTVCKAVPSLDMGKMMWEVGYSILLVMLGVLFGMFPVLYFVSKVISRPLARVSQAMLLFREGDFSQSVEVKTHDEVGEVADCFNVMVRDIKELINKNYVYALKEKESELAALQAQINPHFLYNTLDSLYWQASNADQEEIAENIYALSRLFRLVLGQGEGIVTVAQEAELVTRYLEIQRMRFNKRVEYEVSIAPEIAQQRIPKLILQPFVENAVVHGAESGEENCMVTVTGRRYAETAAACGSAGGKAGAAEEGPADSGAGAAGAAGTAGNGCAGGMEFRVADTGVGMSEEQVAAIWNRKEEPRGSSYKIGRYAIHNVKERLELKYGQDFELRIESEKGKGTTVILRIPMEAEEKEAGEAASGAGADGEAAPAAVPGAAREVSGQ